jgi:hypothetical protein
MERDLYVFPAPEMTETSSMVSNVGDKSIEYIQP